MEYEIDKKKHKIIYIEYQDGLPHNAVTVHCVDTAKIPYWIPVYWFIFANDGDTNYLMAYCEGFGGDDKKINAPQYVDDCKGVRYWMADGIEFEGEPKNIKRLKYPKLLKGLWENSRNPFVVAEITNHCEYCDRCGHYSTEFCYEHKYEDDEGNDRYKDDDSYVDD